MTLAAAQTTTAKQRFERVSDEYFDQVYYPHQPTTGTTAGYHQFDTKLEDFSRASIDSETAALNDFEKRVLAIPAASLDQTTRGDRQMVLNNIHSRLLTLQTIRPWAKNADNYSSTDLAGYLRILGPTGTLRVGGNSGDGTFWTSTSRLPR